MLNAQYRNSQQEMPKKLLISTQRSLSSGCGRTFKRVLSSVTRKLHSQFKRMNWYVPFRPKYIVQRNNFQNAFSLSDMREFFREIVGGQTYSSFRSRFEKVWARVGATTSQPLAGLSQSWQGQGKETCCWKDKGTPTAINKVRLIGI